MQIEEEDRGTIAQHKHSAAPSAATLDLGGAELPVPAALEGLERAAHSDADTLNWDTQVMPGVVAESVSRDAQGLPGAMAESVHWDAQGLGHRGVPRAVAESGNWGAQGFGRRGVPGAVADSTLHGETAELLVAAASFNVTQHVSGAAPSTLAQGEGGQTEILKHPSHV